MNPSEPFPRAAAAAFLRHPAVYLLLAYTAAVIGIGASGPWLTPISFMPWCVVLALCADRYAGRLRLPANAAVLLLCAAAALVSTPDWSEGRIAATLLVLPLMAFLLHRWQKEDEAFGGFAVNSLSSFALSSVVSMLLFLLVLLVLWALNLLFPAVSIIDGLRGSIPLILVNGVLFVYFAIDGKSATLRKFFSVVCEYIITPVFIIYTVVLLVYGIAILASWRLPDGGVAVMCLAWMLAGFFVFMANDGLGFSHLGWVRHAGYLSLPILILLWVAAVRRIADYGFTEARYYLVVCCLMASVFTVLTILGMGKRYFRLTLVSAVLLLAASWTPVIGCRDVVASFHRDALPAGENAGGEVSDGEDDMRVVIYGSSDPFPLEGYTSASTAFTCGRNSLDAGSFSISHEALLQALFANAGLAADADREDVLAAGEALTTYEDDSVRLHLRRISLTRDATGRWRVDACGLSPALVLFK